VRKFYRALSAAPPPLGTLRHHLSLVKRRGLPYVAVVGELEREDSQACELRVIDTREVCAVCLVWMLVCVCVCVRGDGRGVGRLDC
jgi:hypothetical protein